MDEGEAGAEAEEVDGDSGQGDTGAYPTPIPGGERLLGSRHPEM